MDEPVYAMTSRFPLTLWICTAIAACRTDSTTPPNETMGTVEEATTEAETSPSIRGTSTGAVDLGSEMPRVPSVHATRLVDVDVRLAEDGFGELIPVVDPIGVEIDADRWPGRALDPVLVIGERRFYRYSHPGPGRIRFVLANAEWISSPTAWTIRYGTDPNAIAVLPIPDTP